MPHLKSNLILLALTFGLCSVLYPLALLGLALAAPNKATGSLIDGPSGAKFGSRLIGQEFKADEYFRGRPSAGPYNAAASGGSNLAASNPKLRERVLEDLKNFSGTVPADAVTASGSGLDPHVSLGTAQAQVARVAEAWAAKTGRPGSGVADDVNAILREKAFRPLGGLVGGPELVNVLEANLALKGKFEPGK